MMRTLLAAALLLCLPSALPAQEVLAVVGSAPGPYQSAFDAFAAAFGRPFTTVRLPQRPNSGGPPPRVVVAFGSEAALQGYPDGATLIVCVAPGVSARLGHRGRVVYVSMKPKPEKLLAELRRLQPGLKRLAVLTRGREAELYLAELRRAGGPAGFEIVQERVRRPEDLPDALRTLLPRKVDALWLAPDPRLVTPETFQTILQFSWDNHLPFYAPTRGLAEAGAPAAVSISPEETGRLVADLARRTLEGERLPEHVYPDRTKLTVNASSARKAGLEMPGGSLEPADEVLP